MLFEKGPTHVHLFIYIFVIAGTTLVISFPTTLILSPDLFLFICDFSFFMQVVLCAHIITHLCKNLLGKI